MKYGYHPVSIENIAHAAGVTRGAVYGHFQSKRDVLVAVFERIRLRVLDELSKLDDGSGVDESGNRLLRFFRAMLAERDGIDVEVPIVAWLGHYDIFMTEPATAVQAEGLLREMHASLARAIRSGLVPVNGDEKPKADAHFLQALLVGLATLRGMHIFPRFRGEASEHIFYRYVEAVTD